MGIPAFFRWLCKKYPSIVVSADNGFSTDYEFDNLYLDMNCIIHPCTHPENKPAPETDEEMFEAIFEYVDLLLDLVRPTKLIYLAVDGVAPRAKMNQQRSRRFRSVKDSLEKTNSIEQIKDELRLKGIVFEEKANKVSFDSNVITPGTEFMMKLSKALRDWIDKKMSQNQDVFCDNEGNQKKAYVWPENLVVILSDSSSPGEGEHKIIDFIRKQRPKPDYNPNLKHCLFGADADLIMLGLATHELDFTILREEFIPNQPKPCDICNQYGHENKDCQGIANIPNNNILKISSTSFIYIRLCVLREYLQRECDDLDFERFIDDFIFLCFFVGNDFLPHLPSLEIREGAISKLLNIYKNLLSQYSHPKPYLTENGFVKIDKTRIILDEFGKLEDDIFIKRKINQDNYKKKLKMQKQLDHNALGSKWMNPEAIVPRGENPEKMTNVKEEATNLRKETTTVIKEKKNNEFEKTNQDSDDDDEVQLWNTGWKERYYWNKFNSKNYQELSKVIVKEYFIGLCWVMQYYYQGCVDWQWYYPFHYAPFASDFKQLGNIKVKFNELSKPFKPLEQLMSVFPAASCASLPLTCQKLMNDKDSTIIDFYPIDFKIDLNGKKAAWQGVAILPFVNEKRLFRALEKIYPNLTSSEIERNSHGQHLLFVSKLRNKSFQILDDFLKNNQETIDVCVPDTLNGIICKLKKSQKFTNTVTNCFCLEYFDPEYEKNYIFLAQRLPQAILPEQVLKPEDFINKNRNYNNSNNNYKPVIGFTRRNDQSSLNFSSHRMLNFHIKPNAKNQPNLDSSNRSSSTSYNNFNNYNRNQFDNNQNLNNYRSNDNSHNYSNQSNKSNLNYTRLNRQNQSSEWYKNRNLVSNFNTETSYSQNVYSRNPYPQNSYPQNSYSQNSYTQNSYTQDSYTQNSYTQNYSKNSSQSSYFQNTRNRPNLNERNPDYNLNHNRNNNSNHNLNNNPGYNPNCNSRYNPGNRSNRRQ